MKRPARDGGTPEETIESLRARSAQVLARGWHLPPGTPIAYPADLLEEDVYSLLFDLVKRSFAVLDRRRRAHEKGGLGAARDLWREILQMVAYTNGWVLDHGLAAEVPLEVPRELARLLAALSASTVATDRELRELNRRALESTLAVWCDPDGLRELQKVASRSPAAARAFLEEVLSRVAPDGECLPPEWSRNVDDRGMERMFRQLRRGGAPEAMRLIRDAGCTVPHLPRALAEGLGRRGDDCFATRNFHIGPEILDAWLREADAGAVGDYLLVRRGPTNVFERAADCLHLYLVLGPLKLFVLVPLHIPDEPDAWDAGERDRLVRGLSDVIRQAESSIEAGRLAAPDDDFFVIVVGKQVAWCQGGAPQPENFDGIAGHFDDKFPLITAWLDDPRGGGPEPPKIGSGKAGGARGDSEIPSFEPRGRLSTPPQISWVVVDDWSETNFKAGVNVHRRAADHDLGELVARVEGFGWREKPGCKTRVHVLPASSGKGVVRSQIYPSKEEAAEIRTVVGEWFRDGSRVADFQGFVFQETE